MRVTAVLVLLLVSTVGLAADGGAASSVEPPDPGFELLARLQPAPRNRTTLSLTLLPRASHHLHPDAPIVVRPRARGAKPDRLLYTRAEAVDPKAEAPRFEITLTPEAGAPLSVDVACAFTLCRGERCRPVETELRVAP